MKVSQGAKDILAHCSIWGDVPWPLTPEDIIESAERFAKSGRKPRLRAMTAADHKAMATRKAQLRAKGLTV